METKENIEKEYIEKVGRVLGIRLARVLSVHVALNIRNHLDQRVMLIVKPTKNQSEKLKELVFKCGELKQKGE